MLRLILPPEGTFDAPNKVWRTTMNVTKDQLKAGPEFKYEGQWNAGRSYKLADWGGILPPPPF